MTKLMMMMMKTVVIDDQMNENNRLHPTRRGSEFVRRDDIIPERRKLDCRLSSSTPCRRLILPL